MKTRNKIVTTIIVFFSMIVFCTTEICPRCNLEGCPEKVTAVFLVPIAHVPFVISQIVQGKTMVVFPALTMHAQFVISQAVQEGPMPVLPALTITHVLFVTFQVVQERTIVAPPALTVNARFVTSQAAQEGPMVVLPALTVHRYALFAIPQLALGALMRVFPA